MLAHRLLLRHPRSKVLPKRCANSEVGPTLLRSAELISHGFEDNFHFFISRLLRWKVLLIKIVGGILATGGNVAGDKEG